MGADPRDESQLRAKYFDWCSARLAECFLQLPPEEIYELAQQAMRGSLDSPADVAEPGFISETVPTAVSSPSPAEGLDELLPVARVAAAAGISYRVLVARIVDVLAQRLTLPEFESWRAAYLESPQTYEDELLGLWRDIS
jgi:hypothetical protein